MQDKLKGLEEKYGVDWREYKVGDLFTVATSKSVDKGKLTFVPKGFQFIGRTAENNGVQGFIEKLDFEPNPENTFSVSQIGSINAQFRENKWYASQNMFILTPNKYLSNLTKNFKFVITILNKGLEIFGGGYSSYPTQKTLSDLKIKFPTQNNEITFDYIEEFVETLEAERLATLEAYLKATGLNNVALSAEERASLDKLGEANFKKFTINQLFEISTPKKKFNANTISFGGKLPYVARGENNNGIRGYIDEDEKYLNAGNTISFGQDTATMFYQEKPYFTGDKIKIFTAKNSVKFDKKIAWFIISSMRKSFSTFSWGSSSYNVDILNKTEIKLPVKSDGKIDYELMSNLVSAIQKIVIKGVVEWVDKRIELTRGAIKK